MDKVKGDIAFQTYPSEKVTIQTESFCKEVISN